MLWVRSFVYRFFFFNDTATTEIYTLSLHDALPIRFVASLLQELVQQYGLPGDFVGHIGGDDFVVITTPERAPRIGDGIQATFDKGISSQYDEQDLKRGHIMVLSSRQGGV